MDVVKFNLFTRFYTVNTVFILTLLLLPFKLFASFPSVVSEVPSHELAKDLLNKAVVNQTMQPRLYSGANVTQNWSWMAAIYFSTSNASCSHRDDCYDQFQFACAAVKVSPKWLLTAAHCLYSADEALNLKAMRVQIGEQSLRDQPALQSIKQVLLHPSYSAAPFYQHDIALIEITESIEESQLASIPLFSIAKESLLSSGEPLTLLGWGRGIMIIIITLKFCSSLN